MFSRNSIQLLDVVTINQIAAGEVIESAVSVVKELVENALDAGADEIEVMTLGGGQGCILVKDNGCGMHMEEIPMAVTRHATSKIVGFSDVFSLSSFGFRGEALAAIASISKMEIVSCPQEGVGSKSQILGGEVVSSELSSRQRGTTIKVESLFYNVPVRKGFQKAPQADRLAMRRLLEGKVLSVDGVGWSWWSEGQREFEVRRQTSFEERVAFVMGDPFMREALSMDKETASVRAYGFLGSPHFHRPTRQGQKIFINNRLVSSPFISKKMGEAYAMLLPAQRYPVFVLKLSLPPEWCDFNVHPQKTEVRILKEEIVGELLFEMVNETLTCPEKKIGAIVPSTLPVLRFFEEELREVQEMPLQELGVVSSPPYAVPCVEQQTTLCWREQVHMLASLGRVILVKDSEGVYAISSDIVRKHLFYLSIVEKQFSVQEVQHFLVPVYLEVTSQECAVLISLLEDFERLGIEISQMSPNMFSISSAPVFISEEELKSWILFLVSESAVRVDKGAFAHVFHGALRRTMFSKSASMFNEAWLSLFWEIGKPERAFDGSVMCRRVTDEDFFRES